MGVLEATTVPAGTPDPRAGPLLSSSWPPPAGKVGACHPPTRDPDWAVTPTHTAPTPPPQQVGWRPPHSQHRPEPSECRGGSFVSESAQAPGVCPPAQAWPCHPGGAVCVPVGSCIDGKEPAGRGAEGQGATAPRRDEAAGPAAGNCSERGAAACSNAHRGCLESLTILNQRLHVFRTGPASDGADSGSLLGEPLLWDAGAQGGP